MASHPVLRVAVLNDYEIVVAGIASVLGTFPDRVEVVELDSRLPVVSDVDVVLYDTFGQAQGEDLDVEAWVAGSDRPKLVVFSWNVDPALVESSLKAGVDGYVSKGVTGSDLVEALQKVHAGELVTPGGSHLPEGDDLGSWPGEDRGLSPREAEVLALICQGMSNEEIAERAFIGINTVKTYIRTLYRKIEVDSRTKAVLWGIDHGFRPDRVRSVLDASGQLSHE